MRAAIYRSFLLGLALGVSAGAWSRDLDGQWDLKIENSERHAIAALVIEFTAHPAQTCGDGIWRRVHVVSATTEDSKLFPLSDSRSSLSYNVMNNRLVFDRGGVCDGGAFMSGSLNEETIRGDYYIVGRGPRHSGFFTLSKRK